MVRRATGGLALVLFVALAVSLTVFGVFVVSAVDVAPEWEDENSTAGSVDAIDIGISAATAENEADFDRTVFRIEIFENGDARWTTQQSRALDDEAEEEQFREFIEQFESEEMETFENFRVRAQALTEGGTEATDREMLATEFDRSGEVDLLGQTRGIIEMSFVWTNFTETDGDRLVVADVFGGGWAINDDQRLEIIADENLSIRSPEPEPDSGTAEEGSMTWFGPIEFADQRPRVEFVPENETDEDSVESNTDNGTSTNTDDVDDDVNGDPNGDSSIGFLAVALVLVVLVGLGGGLAWYSGVIRRSDGGDTATRMSSSTQSPSTTTESQTSGAADSLPPIEEPVSDEDRVLELLEQNGGRMKQVNIVERTEWSKSKVSMLLSDMEEEGHISKLRVGRENIISLAGQEPEAAGSPFDDE